MAQTPPPTRDDDFPEPPRLRRLRLMVSALLVVLIGGVVIVVAALVINIGALTGTERDTPISADAITLPPGEEIVSTGEGRNTVLIVTRDDSGAERLRSFDRGSGALLSTTAIERAE